MREGDGAPAPDEIPAVRRADEAIRAHVGRVNADKEHTFDLLLIALFELLAHPCQPAVADDFLLVVRRIRAPGQTGGTRYLARTWQAIAWALSEPVTTSAMT